MSPGTEAFSVAQAAPPADQTSESHFADGGQPLVYGSAATFADQAAGAKTPEITIVAEEPARFDLPDSDQPDLVVHAGSADIGVADNEPLLYGSANTIAGEANRPQYASAQIVKEDPNVANLDPGLALPYGNNELGPAAVTGTIVTAPAGTGPGFGSGYVAASQDPDLFAGPAKVTLSAGNQSDIKTDLPTSGTASATQGAASGTALLPSMRVDPNEGGTLEPIATLAATGGAVGTTEPVAPGAATYQSSGQVDLMQEGEAGGDPHTKIPISQYGLSAP